MNVALRQEMGPGGVVMRALDAWRAIYDQFPGGIALTSIRVLCEAEEVLRQGAILIFVDAPVEVATPAPCSGPGPRTGSRASRASWPWRSGSGGTGRPDRPWLRAVQRMATTTIINDQGPDAYFALVEALLGLSVSTPPPPSPAAVPRGWETPPLVGSRAHSVEPGIATNAP